MSKKEAKRLTLRQQLRADATEKLDALERLMETAASRVCEEANTNINPYDLMRMMTSGQNKTVREQLVTDLANEAEAKLMQIYNDQLSLPVDEETAHA